MCRSDPFYKLDFQILLNRLGAEQLLFKLSNSTYADEFIFKGGSLLSYIIDTDRKTKDLDFSVKQIGNNVEDVVRTLQSILDTPAHDGFEWKNIYGKVLEHPDMDQPGVRITCQFLLGHMRGTVRVDIAWGDVVESVKQPLQRIRYKGKPIFGEDFSLLAYPPETIFAEKLHIILNKQGQNTRMKDYYDLHKLMDYKLNKKQLKKYIQQTFANRKMGLTTRIHFNKADRERLELYWSHFFKKEKLTDAPTNISDIISRLNDFLEELYGK